MVQHLEQKTRIFLEMNTTPPIDICAVFNTNQKQWINNDCKLFKKLSKAFVTWIVIYGGCIYICIFFFVVILLYNCVCVWVSFTYTILQVEFIDKVLGLYKMKKDYFLCGTSWFTSSIQKALLQKSNSKPSASLITKHNHLLYVNDSFNQSKILSRFF